MPPPDVKLAKKASVELAALSVVERAEVISRLTEVPLAFGYAHKHASLGLRKLRGNVYEFRASRALRVVFLWRDSVIWIETIGNHEDVKRFLKSKKAK
jgi:hypothetical protein